VFYAERIKAILEEKLPECTAIVIDDVGDHEHFTARVVSSAFDGKSLVAQHQLVYGALGDHMKSDIHALALKTFKPSDWTGE
jgi:stress-induced morphogen